MALESTEERFRQTGARPSSWAEEALVWLAIDQEHEGGRQEGGVLQALAVGQEKVCLCACMAVG